MTYHRFGGFRFGDYLGSWSGILILLIFIIFSFILKLSFWISIISTVFIIFRLLSIILPNCERFLIEDNKIIVLKGKKEIITDIPAEITLIISYADICPPLAMRTAIGNQTHILKDKIAVSIIHKNSLESTLEILHQGYIQKYTTSTIENYFAYRFVYSFVCDQDQFNSLLKDRDSLVIIPESLLDRVSVNEPKATVYIDDGY